MSLLYDNHSPCSAVYVHDELPLISTSEFNFFRIVSFEDKLYGLTVSELHRENLRLSTSDNRYATLFGNRKVSYWAASSKIALAEWRKHNSSNNYLKFEAYDDSSSTFPTLIDAKPLVIIDAIKLGFDAILDKCDHGEALSQEDNALIQRILKQDPDCLAYKSHATNSELYPQVNFMFFEKGFNKLSIKSVSLNLRKKGKRNRARIYCTDCSSDYYPMWLSL